VTRDAILVEDGFDLCAVIYFLLLVCYEEGGYSHDAKAQKKE
jgi:hypothetical protein